MAAHRLFPGILPWIAGPGKPISDDSFGIHYITSKVNPNYGAFDAVTNKWIIEGSGATPNYDVDQDPAAIMAGKNPQLDKAIELLKAQLVKTPRKKVVTPSSKNPE